MADDCAECRASCRNAGQADADAAGAVAGGPDVCCASGGQARGVGSGFFDGVPHAAMAIANASIAATIAAYRPEAYIPRMVRARPYGTVTVAANVGGRPGCRAERTSARAWR